MLKQLHIKLWLLALCLVLGVGNAWADSWVKTNATGLQTGDIVAIVDETSGCAMSNNNGTSAAPAATSVTLNNGEIAEVNANLQWEVTVNNGNYQFNVPGTSNYLYCTNTNNGVRVGTNSNNAFTIDTNNVNFLYNTATSRYIGVYNEQDWRCYTSINANIQNCVTAFYKKTADTDDERTPVTLSFSETTATVNLGEAFTAPTLTVEPTEASSEVGYTSDNEAVAAVATDGTVTLVAVGTAKITASIKDSETYKDASASYTLTVVDPNAPGMTADNPYTVAQARAAIDAGTGVTGVYATGIVSQIVTAYSSQYGNITYNISADGTTTADQLQAFRGKSYNGVNFTSEDDIQVGDVVVVYGDLTKYNTIYEFVADNQLVSLEREEITDPIINAEDVTIVYDATSGSIAYTIINPVEGTSLTATTTAEWISEITVDDAAITFTTTANEGEERSATITLTYGDLTKDVTVTQAAYVAPAADYAVLPFAWEGGASADFKALDGVKTNGLGSDYSTSYAPYLIKFDNTDDYILVKTDSRPGIVTIGVKMIGGGSTSTITVQGSSDGENFTDVEALTISGSQNAVLSLETSNDFAEADRYVKLVFTKGSNVGVGPITIAKYAVVEKFAVNIDENIENGTVTADKEEAAKGATVTLTATPATGYILDALTVSGASGEVEVSEDNTFTMPAEAVIVTATFRQIVGVTYTLATTITSGKHYIITNGTDKAMGVQNSNNRGAVDVTIADGTATVIEGSGVSELVICGPDANGYYTIYDAKTPGYLYAASSSNNYLKSLAKTDANGTWSIEINAEGVATIKAQGDKTRNWMRYNESNKLFSCYASDQKDIYLYEKDDEETPVADYTRSVTSGNYGTICLPYTATITGAKLFKITSKTMNGEELVSVNIDEVKGTAGAGTPYIFQATDATLGAWYTGDAAAEPKSADGLVGTYEKTFIPLGMYVLKDNKVYFVDKEEYVYSGANKAYIDLTDVNETNGTESSVKLYNGDAETGIAQIDKDINDVVIYNLAGQRVSKTTKGIYIINGKKVLK